MPRFLKHPVTPLLLLLAVSLTAGFLTFKQYGLSWDEPLYYDYADSIWKAYTPQAFAPGFDFEQVYGKSADDHKTRGPAYLLLARPLVLGLETLNLDAASAWHLVNFLTFQLIGVGCLYWLMLRWLRPPAALFAAALFASQPLLWGHAFINPKDTIFSAFFIASLLLGLRLVDQLETQGARAALWPGLVFGLTIAMRILAPLAGLITLLYAVIRLKKSFFRPANLLTLTVYGLATLAGMFISWPYLWANPLARFSEVLALMSEHPATIQVLFGGVLYRAYDLPWSYLPRLLLLTLTEPVWPLFGLGLVAALWSRKNDQNFTAETQSKQGFLNFGFAWLEKPDLWLMLLWLALPAAYLILKRPPLSDNFRHFLFILPPIFIFGGLGFEKLTEWLRKPWLALLLGLLLLFPGLFGIFRLYPYEYSYYNQFAGPVNRVYETDYWLTCYRAAAEWVQASAPGATLHVQREPALAEYYAPGLTVKSLDDESEAEILPGDWLLLTTRANSDLRSVYRKLPTLQTFGRQNAEYCILKRKD